MRLRRLTVSLLPFAVAACGDGGPAAPGTAGPTTPTVVLGALDLTVSGVDGAGLGSVVPAVVTARDTDGNPMEVPSGVRLSIVSVTPYFAGSTVVRPFGTGSDLALELVWPGQASVRAVLRGVASAPVTLEVSPREPVIGALLQSRVVAGQEADLTGYRMDLLDPALLGAAGQPLEVVHQDQGSIRFAVPDLGVPTAGCNPSSTVALDVSSVRVFGPPPVLHYGLGHPVELAPGEYEMLGAPSDGCLSFTGATTGDASYTLLFMDGRPIRESETQPEGTTANWLFELLDVFVADRSVQAETPAARVRAPALGPTPEPVQHIRSAAFPDAPPEDYVRYMSRPLVEGEHVSVEGDNFDYEQAWVLKRYGPEGRVVLLGLESEGAGPGLAGGSFRVDPPMEALAAQLPVFARALSDNFPADYRTGQVIFLLRAYRAGVPGIVIASSGGYPGGQPNGYVLFQVTPTVDWATGGPEYTLYALAHETAHLAQLSRDQDLCTENPETACPEWGTGGTWAVEGGADFVANEVTRRAAGFDFDGNTYPPWLAAQGFGGVWRVAGPPGYPFGRGYGYAQWFMHDLMQRIVATGASVDDALAIVGRAAYEPWYGWVANLYFDPVDRTVKREAPHQPVPGLVPRIRAILGPAWDPIEAFLLGAVSQAVDDRTANPALQNVIYGNAYETLEGPFATIRLGSGDSLDLTTNAWSFGWAEITVPANGGDLAFGSPAPDVYWILARTR